MKDCYTDFLPYRDSFGLNQIQSKDGVGETTQNGALFTAEYLICLLADENTSSLIKYLETERVVEALFNLQSFEGVSIRFPGSGEFDSMDNFTALLAVSGKHDDGVFAKLAYKHGQNTRADTWDKLQKPELNEKFFKIANILSFWRGPRFFWNNQRPEQFCLDGWFWRSPAMMGLLKMTASKCTTPLQWIGLLVGQFLGVFKPVEDTDARKLAYVSWQYLKERGIFWNLMYKIWCWKLMKDYPRGMIDVYAHYYGDQNHPLVLYSKPFVK